MIKSLIKYPIQFIFFILIQVFVLNNIQLSGYINPFLYVLFILWLPIEMNKALVMLLAFVLGFSVDIFSDTMGMHASASVFLAFVRPVVLRFIAPRDGYEVNQVPGIKGLGFVWFLTYAFCCVFLHHLFLFFVEVFRFSSVLSTLWRILASTGFTIVLILITQFFNYNSSETR